MKIGSKHENGADIVVIGAGFAGLSTAWHLAKKGVRKIVVVEHEKTLEAMPRAVMPA